MKTTGKYMINKRIRDGKGSIVPKFKNRYGLFCKTKNNHSATRTPNWDSNWLKMDWFKSKSKYKGVKVPRGGFASMSFSVNKKNWHPKVMAHKKVIE